MSKLTYLIAGLGLTIAVAGCSGTAANTDDIDSPDNLTEETAEALSSNGLFSALPGDYEETTTTYPSFTLDKKGGYTLDTGIRCIKAPCPSGETGKWSLYRTLLGTTYYLELRPTSGSSRWMKVHHTTKAITSLTGVFGTTGTWKKKAAAPVTTCAAVRCAAGTYCEDQGGTVNAQCLPDPVVGCAAMLCMTGTICLEDAKGNGSCTAPKCPADGYVNCMPIVPAERQALCSGDYHQWILSNCKGVKFTY